jgi:NTP pyrophosphatase (non-canonical NTP hydrolase)
LPHPTEEEVDALSEVLSVYADIHHERLRAHKKHGANGNSREDADALNKEWLPILVEEVGEVAHWFTYDSEMDLGDLRDELIQVAAMSAAWIASIDEMLSGEQAAEEE